MKQLFTLLLLIGISVLSYAQNPPLLQAQKCLGGTNYDYAQSIQQTKDGGYIVAGYSFSNDGDVSGHHGASNFGDYWIVKLDAAGKIQWQKSLGGTSTDWAYSIQQTSDGGYVVAGSSWSNDGDVSGNHGSSDSWIVKLDAAGNMQWQKSFGGSAIDAANSIQQTTDGGYIVAGYSVSNDGDVSGHHGITVNSDYWILKLSRTGKIQWQKSLGGTNDDFANSIQQTKDGGYIVAGNSYSIDGDVSGHHGTTSYPDYWIIKLDAAGNIQLQKSLGGTYFDAAHSIQQTSDGGYIIAGSSNSIDGDVSGNHGGGDYWIVKLDAAGNIQRQKSFGGSSSDQANSIQQTKDGGYIIAGSSSSNDGDVSGNHEVDDYWVVKLDTDGNIQRQKSLGGTQNDNATSAQQTKDGGFIVAGYSASNDGDVSGHNKSYDYWIIKLSATGNFVSQLGTPASAEKINVSSLRIQPNPVHSVLHIEGLSLIKNYARQENTVALELRIINEAGLVVQQASVKNLSSYDMDVSKLANGIYFLQVGEERVKLVKE